MASRNTILLIGDLGETHDERRAAAGTAIKPGHLITKTAADEVTQTVTAGASIEVIVAKEDSYQGKTVDDAYAPGDPVFFHQCVPGNKIQVILKAGENVSPADYLTPNGDGRVKKATGTDARLLKPAEVLDLSGGGAVDTFLGAYVRG